MKYLIILSSVAILLLYQCKWTTDSVTDNPAAKSFTITDTVEIAYRQTIFNVDENISLRFSSLISDGRCPIDLRCVWEGNAQVEFEFNSSCHNETFCLNTYSGYIQDTTIVYYNIRLIDLEPYPHSQENHHAHQYQAIVVVSKRRWTL